MTLLQMLMATAAVTLGALVQGSVGFGFALVSAPLLLLINVTFVPGPVILASFLIALLVSVRDRKSGNLGWIKWAVAGRIAGSLAGAGLVAYLSKDRFTLIFGILVLLAVAMSISGIDIKINTTNLLTAGLLSGFMGTTVSIGGPPMALLLQKEKGAKLRGMLSLFFMLGILVSIPSLMVMGVFGTREWRLGLILMPGVLCGFFLSKFFIKRLDKHSIRPYVLGLSSLSGLLAILKVTVF
jgi:uncharacterized membrane protein YfcA